MQPESCSKHTMRVIRTVELLGVLCVLFVLTACGGSPSNTYTITGKYLEDEWSDDPIDDRLPDLSAATITVFAETNTDSGETTTVEIGSKPLRDGGVVFSGRIDEPTTIEIAVQAEVEHQDLSARARINPGSDMEFLLVNHRRTQRPSYLALVGKSSLVVDETKKFSITGDFRHLANSAPIANVLVEGLIWTESTDPYWHVFARVALDDGRFVIEKEIDEPTVVEVSLRTHSSWAYTPAVIEPNANITITAPGSSTQAIATMPVGWFDLQQHERTAERQSTYGRLLATAGTGRHARLVESWQQSYEYLAKLNEFNEALQEWRTRQERTGNLRTITPDDSTNGQSLSDDSPNWTAPDIAIAPAGGCEHVDLLAVRPYRSLSGQDPTVEDLAHERIRDEMWNLRADKLTDIAFNSIDPLDSLLATEIGMAMDDLADRHRLLALLDELSSKLDEDLVARRLTHRRKTLSQSIEREENDEKLVPGQKAPEFTLSNLDGDSVVLNDLLQKHDMLLVYFWRAIAESPFFQQRFEELGKIRSHYRRNGFEVVTIGNSADYENWKIASEEYGIDWPNLGEFVEGQIGPVAKSYGAGWTKNYLLDSEGCITQKDLEIPTLGDVLAERYGESPSEN